MHEVNPRLAAWEICVKQIFEQDFKNAVVFDVSSRIINVETSPVSLGLSTGGLLGWLSQLFGTGFCTGGIFVVGGEELR